MAQSLVRLLAISLVEVRSTIEGLFPFFGKWVDFPGLFSSV